MRIHGVHLNGLDSPRGAHQLACEPGYNRIVCSDSESARRLLELLRALLVDPGSLAEPGRWISGVASNARADVSVSFGKNAFRVIADLGGRRVALATYARDQGRPQRASTDPAEIQNALRAAGLPDPEDFELLCVWGAKAAVAPNTAVGPNAERDADATPCVPDEPGTERNRASERREELRRARALYLEVERSLKEREAALEALSPIEEHLDQLELRVELYRLESAQHTRALESILEHRTVLERDRQRLRAAPTGRFAVAWAGLALGCAGAAAALKVAPAFWVLAAFGASVCIAGALSVRALRRGLARVESRLASLRSDERAAELRFENETLPTRRLIQALDVKSADALLYVADEYRAALREVEDTRARFEQARRDIPEDADQILEANPKEEPRSADRPVEEDIDARPGRPDRPSIERNRDPNSVELDALVEAAARMTGVEPDDLRSRLLPVLPVYLRALTAGDCTQARTTSGGEWRFQGAVNGDFAALPRRVRARVRLGFRLALLETLAAQLRVPLLVGPDPDGSGPDSALARSLKRLGGVVQVLQFDVGESEIEHASRVHDVS